MIHVIPSLLQPVFLFIYYYFLIDLEMLCYASNSNHLNED